MPVLTLALMASELTTPSAFVGCALTEPFLPSHSLSFLLSPWLSKPAPGLEFNFLALRA
jgi:hypothetical protein